MYYHRSISPQQRPKTAAGHTRNDPERHHSVSHSRRESAGTACPQQRPKTAGARPDTTPHIGTIGPLNANGRRETYTPAQRPDTTPHIGPLNANGRDLWTSLSPPRRSRPDTTPHIGPLNANGRDLSLSPPRRSRLAQQATRGKHGASGMYIYLYQSISISIRCIYVYIYVYRYICIYMHVWI